MPRNCYESCGFAKIPPVNASTNQVDMATLTRLIVDALDLYSETMAVVDCCS